jgi:ElaB/YqjD/DUF883 family membrane-anchored ribosome-binding protein
MDAAGDKLMQELREVVAAAEELFSGAGSQKLEERIRAHPLAALGIAAGIGLVVGVLLARK